MVMICEAGTHSGINDAFLTLPGYNLVVRADGQDTTDGWCRGLLIWARDGVRAGRFESDLIKDMVECEGVTIPWGTNGAMLTLLLCYRPPRYSGGVDDNGYSDRFCKLLAEIKGQVVICGDLNFSGIDWERLHGVTPAERKVLETVQDNFWTQYVEFPTHLSGKTLDLALASAPELVVGVVDEGLFSDQARVQQW